MKLIHFPFAVFNRLRVEVNLTKTFKRSKLINCIAKNQYENYLIRGATIYDLEQLKKIYRQLNKGEFSKTHIKLLIKCPEKLLLVAEKKVNTSIQIVGMDMFYINPRDFKQKTVHEGFIGVLPDYEGQGIATQMRKDAIRHFTSSGFKGISTRISKNNIGSLRSAEKLGFVPIETYFDEAMQEERHYLIKWF